LRVTELALHLKAVELVCFAGSVRVSKACLPIS
jgi:hypothetical protein